MNHIIDCQIYIWKGQWLISRSQSWDIWLWPQTFKKPPLEIFLPGSQRTLRSNPQQCLSPYRGVGVQWHYRWFNLLNDHLPLTKWKASRCNIILFLWLFLCCCVARLWMQDTIVDRFSSVFLLSTRFPTWWLVHVLRSTTWDWFSAVDVFSTYHSFHLWKTIIPSLETRSQQSWIWCGIVSLLSKDVQCKWQSNFVGSTTSFDNDSFSSVQSGTFLYAAWNLRLRVAMRWCKWGFAVLGWHNGTSFWETIQHLIHFEVWKIQPAVYPICNLLLIFYGDLKMLFTSLFPYQHKTTSAFRDNDRLQ